MSPTTLYIGEPEAARTHGEQAMALDDREQHRSLAFLYGGHDPGVCCRMHSGLALWFLGFPQAALERSRAGLALAMDLSHPHSIANALPLLGVVHQLRGDVDRVREAADTLIDLSTEHGFLNWLAFGRILEDWVTAARGSDEAIIARLRRNIGEYTVNSHLFDSFLFGVLAGAQVRYGHAGEALDIVGRALEMANTRGTRLWDAELYRLKGEFLLARDADAKSEATLAFRRAIEIARGQGARSWELRAVTSLSRLLRQQGKRDEARQMLAEIHGWFTEGFDTADLQAAKTLLDELSVDAS